MKMRVKGTGEILELDLNLDTEKYFEINPVDPTEPRLFYPYQVESVPEKRYTRAELFSVIEEVKRRAISGYCHHCKDAGIGHDLDCSQGNTSCPFMETFYIELEGIVIDI